MNSRSRILRWSALLVLLTLLIGCGGGGGSTDASTTSADPTGTGSAYTEPTQVSYADPVNVSPVDTGSADANPVDASPSSPAGGDGVATLSWTPPTTNLDGSVLTNLAGYKIYYGTQPGSYPNVITINNPGLSAYVIENLQPNTYYFTMTAYNTSGSESPYSNTASKTIR